MRPTLSLSSLLFLFAMLLGACGLPVNVPSHTAAASALTGKTVALVQDRDDGSVRPFCSGVWLSDTTIITASHCVEDSALHDEVKYVVGGDVIPMPEKVVSRVAKLYARDEAHDLALLRALAPPAHGTATVSGRGIRQGSFAQAMGHSLGLWFSYSSGDVSALRSEVTDEGVQTWLVQTTAPISPGNSGGGLFDGSGELIGIAHGYYPRGENLNLFIHKAHVAALVALQDGAL